MLSLSLPLSASLFLSRSRLLAHALYLSLVCSHTLFLSASLSSFLPLLSLSLSPWCERARARSRYRLLAEGLSPLPGALACTGRCTRLYDRARQRVREITMADTVGLRLYDDVRGSVNVVDNDVELNEALARASPFDYFKPAIAPTSARGSPALTPTRFVFNAAPFVRPSRLNPRANGRSPSQPRFITILMSPRDDMRREFEFYNPNERARADTFAVSRRVTTTSAITRSHRTYCDERRREVTNARGRAVARFICRFSIAAVVCLGNGSSHVRGASDSRRAVRAEGLTRAQIVVSARLSRRNSPSVFPRCKQTGRRN